jgi:hypothetical protein
MSDSVFTRFDTRQSLIGQVTGRDSHNTKPGQWWTFMTTQFLHRQATNPINDREIYLSFTFGQLRLLHWAAVKMKRSVRRDRLGEKERSLYDAAMLKIDHAYDDFYEHTTDDEFNALDHLNGIIGS